MTKANYLKAEIVVAPRCRMNLRAHLLADVGQVGVEVRRQFASEEPFMLNEIRKPSPLIPNPLTVIDVFQNQFPRIAREF